MRIHLVTLTWSSFVGGMITQMMRVQVVTCRHRIVIRILLGTLTGSPSSLVVWEHRWWVFNWWRVDMDSGSEYNWWRWQGALVRWCHENIGDENSMLTLRLRSEYNWQTLNSARGVCSGFVVFLRHRRILILKIAVVEVCDDLTAKSKKFVPQWHQVPLSLSMSLCERPASACIPGSEFYQSDY